MSLLPVEDVPIHPAVLIQCPAVGFKARYAAKGCPKCEHFKGVARMRAEGAWHEQFVIRCAHIIERRTHQFEVIEEE